MNRVAGKYGIIYHVTDAYMLGAGSISRLGDLNAKNPYRSGPEYAQFNYGRQNELAGYHDEIELEARP